ncbi:putative glycosyl transferase [Botrimarina colliarenosi]|uniref:Putative glycosyl transferase n=1 Tax=Botrimarina colliarenosi TaxID=2528001 RepID=A0A5C6AJC7_9BACT|nr:glycosyltransferase family 4 protein [Botrimarina colliarenosi]TWT99496.1 putative glycosyl transferase [Botrimarina colliarenosi]
MILERLAADGHDVAVVTAQPSYNDHAVTRQPWSEFVGGVRVNRCWLLPERKRWELVRLLNALLFLFRAVAHATMFRRYDLIIANAHPPVAIGLALRVISRLTGARYVVHLQDIHPESAGAIGRIKSDGRLYKWLRDIDATTCRQAARVVTLSSDMADSLRDRGVEPAPICVINNCQLPTYGQSPTNPSRPLWTSDGVRFLFAGNLGQFQALEDVAAASQLVRCEKRPVGLTFMGAGALEARLRVIADPSITQFVGRQSIHAAHIAMHEAHYGIVSLAPGVIRYAYPSKTLAYLAAGLPLLLIVEADCELSQMVQRHGLGIVSRGAGAEAIAEAMTEAVERSSEWTPERRQQIARFYEDNFSADRMLDAWSRLVRELGNAAAGQPRIAPHGKVAA